MVLTLVCRVAGRVRSDGANLCDLFLWLGLLFHGPLPAHSKLYTPPLRDDQAIPANDGHELLCAEAFRSEQGAGNSSGDLLHHYFRPRPLASMTASTSSQSTTPRTPCVGSTRVFHHLPRCFRLHPYSRVAVKAAVKAAPEPVP